MKLDLTDHERDLVATALETRLLTLRRELLHTDARDYRHGLRAMVDELEAVLARVQGLQPTPELRP
jgi:hypothetical protein